MKRCIPLITPGHCGSSLVMQWLADFGFHSPAGRTDGRHPCGYRDEMAFLSPQIWNDWMGYHTAVSKAEGDFAFKLQSGLVHWPGKCLSILPDPRPVLLLRRDRAHVAGRTGAHPQHPGLNWEHWFAGHLPQALDGLETPLLALVWEEIRQDPQPAIERLYHYTRDTDPPEDVVRLALSRVV